MAQRGGIRQGMDLLAKEQEKRRRLHKLRNDTLRRVAFLKRKAVIDGNEVYHLVRGFFKGFLEKEYEFTITELREELKHIYISSQIRANVESLLDMLEAIEYTHVHFQREHLVAMLDAFGQIVTHLVRAHGRKGLLARIRDFFLKEESEPSVIIAELPAIEHIDAKDMRVRLLIEKCYAALDRHNLHKAKAAYQALMDEYQGLPELKRRDFYQLIHQTYLDIINRAK